MRLNETLGVYVFSCRSGFAPDYEVLGIPPEGNPVRGRATSIEQVGDMIAQMEARIRAQLRRPN